MPNSKASELQNPSAALWLADGSLLDPDFPLHAEQYLTPSEAQRLSGFKRPERRSQYLLGRMLLRHAVSQSTGLPIEQIGCNERPGLSPLLILPEDVPCPAFSLSHSRRWVACIVGFGTTFGLDIEVIDPQRDVGALSSAGFFQNEQSWLLAQTETDRVEVFYQLWTLKEALFKLRSNSGMNDEGLPCILDEEGRLMSYGDDWFSAKVVHAELAIAVCTSTRLSRLECFEWSGFKSA